MATKLGNLSVKTGEYTKDGETKGRYENIGVLWQGDKGMYVILKRSANLAAYPFKEGGDSIIVSVFQDKDDAPKGKASSASVDDPFNDSVPF